MKYINLILCCILLAGCSVGMAMSGKKEPNLAAIKVGATRGEVELHLGEPIEISEDNGQRIAVYEYETGNEPSAGRAVGHGVMDVLTLGIWEVVGTPIEGFQGKMHRLKIGYGSDDKVTSIATIPVPKKETKPEPVSTNDGVPIN